MKRTKKRMTVCLTLLVLTLLFIWGNSCAPAEVSAAFSRWVRNLLLPVLGGGSSTADKLGEGLLRKIAHGTEFCGLGLCLSWLMYMIRSKKYQAILLAVFCGLIAAAIDETIQCFVPGRGPGLLDVGIDMFGICIGVGIITMGLMIRHGRLNKLEEIKQ